MRGTILTFPSIYELMPHYPNCCVLASSGAAGLARRGVSVLDPDVWNSMPWMPAELRGDDGKAFVRTNLQSAVRIRR